MMQVSPRMQGTDGPVEGMAAMEQLGEAQGPNCKQGQGRSRKQDRLGVFAKLLEGLLRKSGGSKDLNAGMAGEAETPAAEMQQGKSPAKGQKNQSKKNLLSSAEAKAEGKASSGERVRRDTQEREESQGLFAAQGGNDPEELVYPLPKEQGSLQKEKHPGSLHTQVPKATSSRKETAGVDPLAQAQAAVREEASKTSGNREIEADTSGEKRKKEGGAEKAGVRTASLLRSSPGVAEQIQLAGDPRLGTDPVDQEGAEGSRKGVRVKVGDKRRDRIEGRDLRSREAIASTAESRFTGDAKPLAETKGLELRVELPVDSQDRETAPSAGETSRSQRFEDLLARELSQTLNSDIVRQAQVLLREGGEGTIRLSLRPESLGNVKIQLELAEKKITGHIIVESSEALRAFEREIQSLEQAFKDSGFGEASLDTALASGSDGNGRDPPRREGEAGPFFSERFAASTYDAGSERTGEAGIRLGAAVSGSSSGHIPIDMLV
ncbi:MAG: flagellar hook-length control protein FliK [Treponema sp.]|jgi:hypothetical protein|nr:flagellar hook-length control protein FliK [Treponema sp.]